MNIKTRIRMKQRILFCLLMAAMTLSRAMAQAPAGNLSVDTLWAEGRVMAQYEFAIVAVITNQGDADFDDYLLVAGTKDQDESVRDYGGDFVTLKAGETQQVRMVVSVRTAGTYTFFVGYTPGAAVADVQSIGPSIQVSVAEFAPFKLRAEYTLNMSTEEAGGNVVYGNRIAGRVLLINDEDEPIVTTLQPFQGIQGFDLMLVTDLDQPTLTRVARLNIGNEIAAHDTIVADFCFDADMREGKLYNLGILFCYGELTWRSAQAGIYAFTSRSGLCTYWTARGEVKTLPCGGDNQHLRVPAEAVVVDMRGSYRVNTAYLSMNTTEANPNCLYYFEFMDNVPQGLAGCNVVRDYVAQSLQVADGYDFYCPMPFKAANASYMLTPRRQDGQPDPSGSATYSETLTLPFDATMAMSYDANEALALDDPNFLVCRFAGDEGMTLLFDRVGEWPLQSYEPYLLGYLSPARILLQGADVQVPATRPAIARGWQTDFVGTTIGQTLPSDGSYYWHRDLTKFLPMAPNAVLQPFRCGAVSRSAYPVLLGTPYFANAVTGVQGTIVPPSGSVPVFSLKGQQVATARLDSNGRIVTSGLSAGIYIVDGKKFVVTK